MFKFGFNVKGMDNVVHGCFIWQCINYLFGDIFESHLIPPYGFHEMKTLRRELFFHPYILI